MAGVERQSDPARIEPIGEETMALMEEVLSSGWVSSTLAMPGKSIYECLRGRIA